MNGFKDEDEFVEFCRKEKAVRQRILNNEPSETEEVDQILNEVKKKAEVIKHDGKRSKRK